MLLGSLNFLLVVFFLILTSIVVNINTGMHLLLTAEFLWITLYAITLIVGFFFDNLNLLSLTFFFLILSAVEFAIGLILLTFSNLVNRSILLNMDSSDLFKFSTRFFNKISVNRFKF